MKDDKINGASARPEEPQDDFEVRERKRWTFFGLPFTFTTYTLTPKKLTVQTGLFTTAEDDILLFRIMDTSYRRTFIQKLFGLGNILVASRIYWTSRWKRSGFACGFAPANMWGWNRKAVTMIFMVIREPNKTNRLRS